MEKIFKEPGLTTEGIVFSVEVDSVEREFLILKSALTYLCKLQGFTMDFMNTYRACEARIHSIAPPMLPHPTSHREAGKVMRRSSLALRVNERRRDRVARRLAATAPRGGPLVLNTACFT